LPAIGEQALRAPDDAQPPPTSGTRQKRKARDDGTEAKRSVLINQTHVMFATGDLHRLERVIVTQQ